MKKAMLRKLRAISSDILGEEQTDKIIKETVDNFLNEIKLKKKSKKKKSDK